MTAMDSFSTALIDEGQRLGISLPIIRGGAGNGKMHTNGCDSCRDARNNVRAALAAEAAELDGSCSCGDCQSFAEPEPVKPETRRDSDLDDLVILSTVFINLRNSGVGSLAQFHIENAIENITARIVADSEEIS
jgi:hypothetical protein